MYVQFISIYSKWNAVRCQNEKYIAMLSALCKHSQLRNCSHILKIFLPYKKVMVLNFPYIYKNRVMNNRKCFYICTLFFNFKTRKTRVGYFKITFWIFLLHSTTFFAGISKSYLLFSTLFSYISCYFPFLCFSIPEPW